MAPACSRPVERDVPQTAIALGKSLLGGEFEIVLLRASGTLI